MLLPPLLTLENAWRINSRGAPTLAAGPPRTRGTQSTQEGSAEARRSQRLGRGGRAKGSCGQRALENETGQICLFLFGKISAIMGFKWIHIFTISKGFCCFLVTLTTNGNNKR